MLMRCAEVEQAAYRWLSFELPSFKAIEAGLSSSDKACSLAGLGRETLETLLKRVGE